jgi:tetratricopeptide (TPR) repeat protein
MARADRRRARRAPAPPVQRSSATVTEHELFFSRLRRQARWIFVLLAIIFGGSFVVFGVGSEVPGGIADVLGRTPGFEGVLSVSDARKEVEERPNDPDALRQLATALQTEGQTREAIETLERLRAIAPRDQEALRELATLYVARAGALRSEAQQLQAEAQALAPDDQFLPPPDTDIGRALADRPISASVTGQANERFTEILTELQSVYSRAQGAYLELAELSPEDPTIQLQLADTALNAGDSATALAAYQRFLELAPDDPTAPLVQQEINRLSGEDQETSG